MNKRFWTRRFMDEGGEGGDPGTGAPPAGGTPPAAGGTPPAGAWYDSFKNNDTKEWLKSYGEAYPDPEAVATKALNLEKFIGAEKSGRGVVTPKADAKPEEWQEFYKKVGGVPESADGYKLPADLDPNVSSMLSADPMVAAFKEHALNTGMPPMFFESAMKWYTDTMVGKENAAIQDFSAQAEKDMTDLKSEWKGVEFDKNIEMGRRAAEQFIPHANKEELKDKIARIEGALGTKETLKLWASIGGAMGEHSFESGGGDGDMGSMTAESARVRIAILKKDSGFSSKLANGDADAKAEWDRLHKIGFGG